MESYSVSVRLQRTTVEERYVSVPVTDAVMRAEPDPDGSRRLDADKLLAAAIELGRDDTDWLPEEREVTIHPIQKAPDDVSPLPDSAQDSR
ncbi:hypothetical protein ACWDG9_26245 [Streptomyces sp. NPDC001073]|uniref:hypothetical protein n=1 Tax=Streptomyces sp. NPDC001642 TaxID=3154392 RepID=UPI00332EE76A